MDLLNKEYEIGYIGFDEIKDIEESLKNHLFFQDKTFHIHEESDLFVMLSKLRNEEYDYIIIPSRNEENEINDLFLSLISRIDIEGINEIGMLLGKLHYETKTMTFDETVNSNVQAMDRFKRGNQLSTYQISQDEKENKEEIQIEYRIFKKNLYETPKNIKFGIWLLKNDRLKHFIEFSSGFVVFAMLIFLAFRLIPSVNEELEQISILVELFATITMVLLQLILRIADTEESIKRKMIVGHWIYYSLEETDAKGKFVPKGFRTRLVEISDNGGNLSFKCKFEGEDEIFFATDTLTFDYDISSQMGRGFYYYTSNIVNNDGKRAEGTCRFEGETIKNNQIMTMNGWFFSRGTSLTGKVRYFRITEKDYHDLQSSMSFYKLNIKKDERLIIGVYGCEASNTDVASKDEEIKQAIFNHHKEVCPLEYAFFEDIDALKRALNVHQVDYIIVPSENRGNIIKSHDIFEKEKYENVFSKEMDIYYYLAVEDGNLVLDEHTTFYGHKQSLEQCKKFIKNRPTIEEASSSRAALNMSKGYYQKNAVVLCNEEAIRKYHLTYLKDENDFPINPYLEDVPNRTKFVVYHLKSE